MIAELVPGVAPGELPVDLDAGAVHLPIPCPRFPLEREQVGNSALAKTLPGIQTNLDLRLIQPTAVLRCIVHRQAVPQVTALLLSVGVGEGLAAMNGQVVHDQVNGSRPGVTLDQRAHDFGELRGGPVRFGVGQVKCLPAWGSTAQKTLAVPQRLYSLSRLAILPGAIGRAGRTSACRETGFSSTQTTGSAAS